MRKLKFALLTTSLLASGWIPDMALAQTTASNDAAPQQTAPSDQLQEVFVTAQKRTQSLQDVGLTVDVLSARKLEEESITSPQDLSRVVPGLTVSSDSSGTPIYTLRGVSFNSTTLGAQPTVSVYLDEAPVPFAAMTQGPLFDLAQVEVLKGPQGTLFGQNATAGAINYIAAKPTDQFSAGIEATYGRFETGQVEGYVSGPVTDTLTARLSGTTIDSGPWQHSVTRDAQLGDQRKAAARFLTDWKPTDRLRVQIDLNGWLDSSDTQAPQRVTVRPANPASISPLALAAPNPDQNATEADWDPNTKYAQKNNYGQVAVRADYDLADHMTLTSLTSYAHATINSLYDWDGTQYQDGDINVRGHVDDVTQELRLSGTLPALDVHYIGGGNYQHDSSYEGDVYLAPLNSSQHVPPIGGFNTAIAEGYQRNDTYAGFGNIDWSASDQVTLSTGLRYTEIDHYSLGCTRDLGDGQAAAFFSTLSDIFRGAYGLPAGPPIAKGGCVTLGPNYLPFDQAQSFDEHNLSWRENLEYKPTPDLALYETISRGYKGGNYPIAASGSYLSIQPVRQEELTSYEVGTKQSLFDGKLSFNLAGYYYDYLNKQLQTFYVDPVFGLLYQIKNVPKSSVRGFDADATVTPLPGLTIRPAVTYAQSAVGTFSGFNVFGQAEDLTGKPFNFAPKWISTGDIEYRHDLTDMTRGFAGATVTYNSRTFGDLAQSPSLVMRAYNTLDLRVGLTTSSGWDVMLFGKNVTNAYHWTYAMSAIDSVIRFAAMPAVYGLSAGYKF